MVRIHSGRIHSGMMIITVFSVKQQGGDWCWGPTKRNFCKVRLKKQFFILTEFLHFVSKRI